MTHDITFCASTQCPLIATCRRAHPPVDVEWLMINNFYDPDDEKCKAYWPTGEKK